MKIKSALYEAKKQLTQCEIEDSGIIARNVLLHVLKKDTQFLVINMEKEISSNICDLYFEKIKDIIKGIPIQYITNKQEFMGLEFYVDENVLIPQPDTETLVENILQICSEYKLKTIRILDLCTGSGAIAISLYSHLKKIDKKIKIFASDISSKALEIAKKNNILNNTKIEFIQSNLFENIENKDFDIIVSNPPYIKTQVIDSLSKQVKHEPKIALDGGEDGLYFYEKIINKSNEYIKKQGYLCLEIGFDQAKEVTKIFNNNSNYSDVKILKDLSNNDRCIIAKIKK